MIPIINVDKEAEMNVNFLTPMPRFSIVNFEVLYAANDSHIKMLMDAKAEDRPGRFGEKNISNDEHIMAVNRSDLRFIFVSFMVLSVFIASIPQMIDMYVIGIVGDKNFSERDE